MILKKLSSVMQDTQLDQPGRNEDIERLQSLIPFPFPLSHNAPYIRFIKGQVILQDLFLFFRRFGLDNDYGCRDINPAVRNQTGGKKGVGTMTFPAQNALNNQLYDTFRSFNTTAVNAMENKRMVMTMRAFHGVKSKRFKSQSVRFLRNDIDLTDVKYYHQIVLTERPELYISR